ncbi:MAG: efflux RND transporter periplasmic adaptor subunit [Candidatus Hydrogenedentes bacterium]|nr:efflux RND transporter periplasmic adaptor subunit [Candidatus Hydrogenedentota bacterium]
MNKQMTRLVVAQVAIVVLAICMPGCEKGFATDRASHDAGKATATEPEAQRDPNRLWCKEHNVYEDECTVCHPELKQDAARAGKDEHRSEAGDAREHETGASNGGVPMCGEHRLPEAECGNCRPDTLSTLKVGQGLKVRLPSDSSLSKAGVTLGRPTSESADTTRSLLGHVSFNRNKSAAVTTLLSGVLVDVFKDVGEQVREGEIVATVRSPELAQVAAEYKKALAEAQLASQSLSREKDLFEKQISARQDLEAAQAASAVCQSAVNEARQHLLNLGLEQSEIDKAVKGGKEHSLAPIRAPFDATVIDRSAARGAAVEPGTPLLQIVDLSTMWLQLSVPESALSTIGIGLDVRAHFDAYPESTFSGTIDWIAPIVDPQTRMVQARAVLANPDGLLKDGLFGRVEIGDSQRHEGITVPSGAVQEVDGIPVVFRRLEDDLFETRRIDTRPAADGRVVVLAGLASDEEIVTEGSYIVKSELLKARLGAGCADH